MTTIKKILFPVDFWPFCVTMAHFVERVVSIASARLTLLHVLEVDASGFGLFVWLYPENEKICDTPFPAISA